MRKFFAVVKHEYRKVVFKWSFLIATLLMPLIVVLISIVPLIIFSINLGVSPIKGFALLLGLYGFWILIYGTALNFKPSIIGAFITWGLAFACLYVQSFEWTMLLHALAVLCGYIIPGHIAYAEFKKIKLENKE